LRTFTLTEMKGHAGIDWSAGTL